MGSHGIFQFVQNISLLIPFSHHDDENGMKYNQTSDYKLIVTFLLVLAYIFPFKRTGHDLMFIISFAYCASSVLDLLKC